MTNLAKAYKMLKTCNIKSGRIHVINEMFEAGQIYATKDIIAASPRLPEVKRKDGTVTQKAGLDDRRLRLWINMGFCVPAGDGASIAAVATPDEKATAKQEAEDKRTAEASEKADAKAQKEAAKLEAEELKAEAKAAKEKAAEAKKLEAEQKKIAKDADKAKAAEEVLEAKELKANKRLWKDVPVEDYPKYVALLNEQGYEFEEDVPDPENHDEWLAYFVPFFGEGGPPELAKAE